MPERRSDPIKAVKAFLRGEEAPRKDISHDLREIGERLSRARKVERRLQLSESLEALFRNANATWRS